MKVWEELSPTVAYQIDEADSLTLSRLRALEAEQAPVFVRVLQALDRVEPRTGRQVAAAAGLSPTWAIKTLGGLQAIGAVTKTRMGRADRWLSTPPAAAFLANRRR